MLALCCHAEPPAMSSEQRPRPPQSALSGAHGSPPLLRPAQAHAAPSKVARFRPEPPPAGRDTPGAGAARPGRSEPRQIVVMVGGDVNLGRACGQRILANPAHDPFGGIAGLWATADLRVVNLESVLSDQGGETVSPTNRFAFTGPPDGARTLSRAHVDVVSLANNHAWDYGLEALLATLRYLDDAGVERVGGGANLEEAERAWSGTRHGLRLAIVAGTGTWNQGELDKHPGRAHVASGEERRMVARVGIARRENDFVLASYHGGAEYSLVPPARTRQLARAAIHAGADAFVVHHPHVPQGVGFIDGKPVLYSLGNLVFRHLPEKPWTNVGLLAQITFSKEGAPALRLCPVSVGDYLPQAMDGPEQRARLVELRRRLLELSQPLGPVVFGSPDDQGCFGVAPNGVPASRSGAPASRESSHGHPAAHSEKIRMNHLTSE